MHTVARPQASVLMNPRAVLTRLMSHRGPMKRDAANWVINDVVNRFDKSKLLQFISQGLEPGPDIFWQFHHGEFTKERHVRMVSRAGLGNS